MGQGLVLLVFVVYLVASVILSGLVPVVHRPHGHWMDCASSGVAVKEEL